MDLPLQQYNLFHPQNNNSTDGNNETATKDAVNPFEHLSQTITNSNNTPFMKENAINPFQRPQKAASNYKTDTGQLRRLVYVGDLAVDEHDYKAVLPLVQALCGLPQPTPFTTKPSMIEQCFWDIVLMSNHRISGLTFHSGQSWYSIPSRTLSASFSSPDALQDVVLTRGLTTLPSEVGNLRNLVNLSVQNTKTLSELPDSLSLLLNLKTLHLKGNHGLTELPLQLPPNLEELDTQGTPVQDLPSSIGMLKSLKILRATFSHFLGLPTPFTSLSSLEVLDTDRDKPFHFPVPLMLPRLRDLVAHNESLEFFQYCGGYSGSLQVNIRATEMTSISEHLENILHIRQWKKLSGLSMETHAYDGAELDAVCAYNAIRVVLTVLSGLTYASLQGGPRGLSLFHPNPPDAHFKLSLGDLKSSDTIEELHFEEMSLIVDRSNLSSNLFFKSLKVLHIGNCEVDLLSLPKLEASLIEDMKIGAPFTEETFELLTVSWFSKMKNLHSLICGNHDIYSFQPNWPWLIPSISAESVQLLATLKLRRIELYFGRTDVREFRGPERHAVENAKLLPLVKACSLLGGGLGVVAESSQIINIMFENEARSKILGSQAVPLSLWPLVFECARKAFEHKGARDRKILEQDAVYALLRKRAAMDIFGRTS